jgi:hypothetical protein
VNGRRLEDLRPVFFCAHTSSCRTSRQLLSVCPCFGRFKHSQERPGWVQLPSARFRDVCAQTTCAFRITPQPGFGAGELAPCRLWGVSFFELFCCFGHCSGYCSPAISNSARRWSRNVMARDCWRARIPQ